MPGILSEAGMRAGTQTTIRHKFETDNGNKGEVWELIQTLVSGRVPASRRLTRRRRRPLRARLTAIR